MKKFLTTFVDLFQINIEFCILFLPVVWILQKKNSTISEIMTLRQLLKRFASVKSNDSDTEEAEADDEDLARENVSQVN